MWFLVISLIVLFSSVPVGLTTIKTLYVFVDIGIDKKHFIETVIYNLASPKSISEKEPIEIEPEMPIGTDKKTIALVATIQFVASLQVSIILL